MSLEAIGARDSRDLVSKQFDYLNCHGMFYNVEEHFYLLGELGVTIRSSLKSLINGSDETYHCKSLRLSHGH